MFSMVGIVALVYSIVGPPASFLAYRLSSLRECACFLSASVSPIHPLVQYTRRHSHVGAKLFRARPPIRFHATRLPPLFTTAVPYPFIHTLGFIASTPLRGTSIVMYGSHPNIYVGGVACMREHTYLSSMSPLCATHR